MQRRTLLSASLGLGAVSSLAGDAILSDPPQRISRQGNQAMTGLSFYSGMDLAFGTTVSIKVLHTDRWSAETAIQDALHQVKKIDALMSVYQERSQVFQLNRDGVLESPDPHLLRVLEFSRQLSILTAGAFDVTVQPLWQAYTRARTQGRLPVTDEIAAAKALVNWRRVEVCPQHLRFQATGMGLTLNGVAQGYAVDLALKALLSHGVQHALLDTGEFGSVGRKSPSQPWVLGIGDPRQHDALAAKVALDGRKVATSGDYETFFSPDFIHHHIFDPTTGVSPLELASVTVVAPTGILADGLSTAFMVMGADKALAMTAKWNDVDTLLIHKNGAIIKSPNFPEWRA